METKKPVVGVMPLWDDEKDSLWMLPGYLDGLSRAGAIPFIFPFLTDGAEIARLAGFCDGFLFTGGHDVSPELYREKPLDGLISSCEKRDRMEAVVLKLALESDKPALGICRGIQFINAALGGTLYQDLPLQHPSEINHHGSAPYDRPVHDVAIASGSPLRTLLGRDVLPVNSFHHQAIKDLAPGLEVMATAPDGITEAVFMPGRRFLWAVQWHPEFSYKTDENSRKIFAAFAESMKG
ncbi:MAG: gamma-glutamyl-gamma-aminobutyrate hydrolase family protein [Clostridia bacterium]|nr:gamma-glutamyl-gamma-aminobutyrate hydrolase family protein [Clostridia bacterium]